MTLDPFDPARLGLRVEDKKLALLSNGSQGLKLPRPSKGERYFGPIPMAWIERSASLPGRAWHLACALWFEAVCTRGKPAIVKPTRRTLQRFGLSSDSTYYRALKALELAGLIRVEPREGRRPLVTILPVGHDVSS